MSVLSNIISLKNKGYSNRSISDQLGLSRKTTNKYVSYLKQSGLIDQALLNLSDEELTELVVTTPARPAPGYLQELYDSKKLYWRIMTHTVYIYSMAGCASSRKGIWPAHTSIC